MAVMRAADFGQLGVDRRRLSIGRAMDLFALVGEAVAGASRIVFVVCCWEAYLAVVQVDFRMTTVLAELEVALRSMIVEACSAYSAGSWAESRVARWHTACYHSLPRSAYLIQKRRQLGVVSSPDVRSALGRLVLQDCMPLARVDVIAAVLVVEKRLLLQTALIRVGLGTNALKPCFPLEDGSVYRLQSFPAVGLQDSWSRDARPSLLWMMRVHYVYPAFPMARYSAGGLGVLQHLSPSTNIRRECVSCRGISVLCARRMCPSATPPGWQSPSGPTQK